jgi:hypothetical protein
MDPKSRTALSGTGNRPDSCIPNGATPFVRNPIPDINQTEDRK